MDKTMYLNHRGEVHVQTGMFTIIALAISTSLCAVAAVSFCRSNVFNNKRQNNIILMMGAAAILWNIMSLGYSISTEEKLYHMFFYLLIAAFDLYVVALCLYIGKLVGMSGRIYNAFVYLGILLVFQCFKKSKLKRQHMFVLKIVLANCVMFLLALPDTLLPLFHIPSYPSSGIGVTIAFIGTIFWTTKENTFSISKDNVTDAIYNEAKIAIIVLNVDGKIDSCNNYAKQLLEIGETEKCRILRPVQGGIMKSMTERDIRMV